MTEYDFSPEAYEQHLRTQARIARWVDQTEAHRGHFGPEACQLVDPRWAQHRRAESEYDGRPRPHRTLTGSSASSEDAPARHPLSPGPMPVMNLQPSPVYQPTPRRPKTHRPQNSSYNQPVYLYSPPTSPPAQGYPYAYNSMTGQVTSPGNSTNQSTAGSYFPQGIYAMPQNAGYRPPGSSPASTYPIYAPNTGDPMQPTTNSQPYSAPPTIYPLTSSAPATYGSSNYYLSSSKQDQNSKPVFYQKIFKDKRSKSGRSR